MATADVIAPTDLPVGSQYQLAFVTSLTTSATSKDTAFYNAFVTDRAAASATLPNGVSWTAMAGAPSWSYIIETGSGPQFIVVPAVTPQQNAPTSSIPIYNTRGQRVVASGSTIWSRTSFSGAGNYWDNPIQGDEYGVLLPMRNPNTQLGDVMYGSLGTWVQSGGNYVSNGALMTYSSLPYWMQDEFPSVSSPSTVQMRLFAISSPITFVPEPCTSWMALAGLACGGFSMWRQRRRGNKRRSAVVVASLLLALACLAVTNAHALTIDWVTVGNPGNTNDTTGYGAVNYEYQIGKYEVTIGQYTDFLNAVAQSDPYSLYSTSMASNLNIAGISRSGTSGVTCPHE